MAEQAYDKNRGPREMYMEHCQTVYRVAFTYMKNSYDAEDAVQETFARLIRSGERFRSREKEKAWLIVTVSNVCKDMLRRHYRSDRALEDYQYLAAPPHEIDETMEAILRLPGKYKTAVYLFYYEGYTAREIARMLGISESAVGTRILRGRAMLKEKLDAEGVSE